MKKKQYKNYYKEEDDELDQYTLNLDDSEKYVPAKRQKGKRKEDGSGLWYYVGFASDFGFSIAIPIVGGALAGYAIDRKWQTYPKATLSLLLFGIVISFINFIRTVRELLKKKN